MSFAFNQDQALRGMFFYDASAGTYTDRNLTTGDYFDNNAAVGDCLYFSVGGTSPLTECPYQGLKFNVGTALAASSITIVWEYQNHGASTWAALSGVTDNTNNFTTTGVNYVTWTVPSNWGRSTSVFGNYDFSGTRRGLLVRARISAVSGITEGGANTTNAIQYKDYKITATNEGSLTMASLYTQSSSGGWNVIDRLVDQTDYDVYQVNCNVHLAGTTSFSSSRQIIIVGTDAYRWTWTTISGSTFQLGLLDATTGLGWKGSTFVYYSKDCYASDAPFGGTTKIYGSNVHRIGGSYYTFTITGVTDIRDSQMDIGGSDWYYFSAASSGTVYRTVLYSYYVYFYTANISIDKLYLPSVTVRMYIAGGAVLSNTEIGSAVDIYRYASGNISLVNCTGFSRAKLLTSGSSGTSVTTYEKYTVDITVVNKQGDPISGATVTILDNTGAIITSVTTDGSGVMTQQTLTAYSKTWTSATSYAEGSAIIVDFNPFSIRISSIGYEDYEITMDILRPEILKYRLRHSHAAGRDAMGLEFR